MTATVDYRRSDHERAVETAVGPPPLPRERHESLCLSELVNDILEDDAEILRQAGDFMQTLPTDGDGDSEHGDDEVGGHDVNHDPLGVAMSPPDPFAGLGVDDFQSVFAPLDNGSSAEAFEEDTVNVEFSGSSEEPKRLTSSSDSMLLSSSPHNGGCARTVGVMPQYYSKMKLRFQGRKAAASTRSKSGRRMVDGRGDNLHNDYYTSHSMDSINNNRTVNTDSDDDNNNNNNNNETKCSDICRKHSNDENEQSCAEALEAVPAVTGDAQTASSTVKVSSSSMNSAAPSSLSPPRSPQGGHGRSAECPWPSPSASELTVKGSSRKSLRKKKHRRRAPTPPPANQAARWCGAHVPTPLADISSQRTSTTNLCTTARSTTNDSNSAGICSTDCASNNSNNSSNSNDDDNNNSDGDNAANDENSNSTKIQAKSKSVVISKNEARHDENLSGIDVLCKSTTQKNDAKCPSIDSNNNYSKNNNRNTHTHSGHVDRSINPDGTGVNCAIRQNEGSSNQFLSAPAQESPPAKPRHDGTIVSPRHQAKAKPQKVIPRSLVEKLRAAAQRATARQSIMVAAACCSKPAEQSLISLDHDYCCQAVNIAAAAAACQNRDNLEVQPMDVESEDEQGPTRIEVLPDLSLAKRQEAAAQPTKLVATGSSSSTTIGNVNRHLTATAPLFQAASQQAVVEVVVRHPTSQRSLLKVNQPLQDVFVQQVVTLHSMQQQQLREQQLQQQTPLAVALDSSVGDQMLWSEQQQHGACPTAYVDTFSGGGGGTSYGEGIFEEEVIITTAPSEGGQSDSGFESLDRRRESRERDEAELEDVYDDDDGDENDDGGEDGREGRRWRDSRTKKVRVKGSSRLREGSSTSNTNNNYGGGGNNNSSSRSQCSSSDSVSGSYRRRRRRRSTSSNSSRSSSSSSSSSSRSSSLYSSRSRSSSSRSRECKCVGDRGRHRQRSTSRDSRGGHRGARSRSRSRRRCGRRCRYPSPDYTVGSHASRQRSIEVSERKAYAAAGWESSTSGKSSSESAQPPVRRKERKNIWCMDTDTLPAAHQSPPPVPVAAVQEALENIRKGGDRKIIYVGKIPEGTTRQQIREWFGRFGNILAVSLHFRDTGENYGFVTFEHAEDAYRAVERGNEDPSLPHFKLCFGGRRQFCGQQWSDLDGQPEKDYLQEGLKDLVKKDDDFDSLLRSLKGAAPSGARRK